MIKTLQDVVFRASKYDKGMYVINGKQDSFITYEQLFRRSLALLKQMQGRGILPRQEVILHIEDHVHFLYAFWSCVLGNLIPVPVTASTSPEHLNKLEKIWHVLNAPYMISDMDMKIIRPHLLGDSSERIITLQSIDWSGEEGTIYPAEEEQTAFIQFSSGSTGDPKGGVLTNKNLLTNIRAMINGMDMTGDERIGAELT